MIWVGLMSGTSLDGVDAALLETDGERLIRFGPGLERPYTLSERKVLQAAVDAALQWRWQGEAPDVFADAEAILAVTHAEAVEAVCAKAGIVPSALDGVGFHGQTVLHRAPKNGVPGRTLQIGNGQALANRLGCGSSLISVRLTWLQAGRARLWCQCITARWLVGPGWSGLWASSISAGSPTSPISRLTAP